MSKDDEKELDYENDDNNDEKTSVSESYETDIDDATSNDENDNNDIYNTTIDKGSDNEELILSKNRITKPILYNYEFVRIVGLRERQLTLGAKPLIKCENLTYKEIAYEEIKYNIIPYIIIRTLPNGNKEKWQIEELSKDYLKYNI